MLNKDLLEDNFDENILKEILFDFHKNGPINNSHLETISYLKAFSPSRFNFYEPRLMHLMGLFYKTDEPESLIELIYSSYAKTILENTGHQFTPIQGDAYLSIKKHTNFSFSAPTSAGKSFLFQELIKEIKGDIIIIIPSRALISEYLIKIKNLVSKETLVLEFIEVVNIYKTKNRIFIITPERGDELFAKLDLLNIELILLDEAQLTDEGIRGMKFDSFVRRVNKKLPHVKKVFTHPFLQNPEAQFKKNHITKDIDSEVYEQKTVGKIYLSTEDGKFNFFSPFDDKSNGELLADKHFIKRILKNNGTLLIYISKTKIYSGEFLEKFSDYIELCPTITNKESLYYINKLEEFLGTNTDEEKYSLLIYLMKKGIVIHHGSIPLKARLLIEKFVNENHAKICFSTSTLIQGINMPFDVVWINNFRFEGNADQKILNMKNLIGRAGRTTREKNTFDFGYVIIEKQNKKTFIERINKESNLSEISLLDIESESQNDFKDIIDAIKDDDFNIDLHLPNVQVERLSKESINEDILFILNHLINQKGEILSVKEYYSLDDTIRDRIKYSLEKIFTLHLRRNELTKGEKSILTTAIPILLWQIQGKSFAEIISLRHAFLSEKDYRRQLLRRLKKGEISEKEMKLLLNKKKVRFSCIAESLPNSTFKRPVPLFSQDTSIRDLDFDKIIYDTYDYTDKVLSLSLKDPLSAAFILFFQRTADGRALTMSNYIKYGTNDAKEIWLLKYGFSFEEIEKISDYIEHIDENEIVFKKSIADLKNETFYDDLIERYI